MKKLLITLTFSIGFFYYSFSQTWSQVGYGLDDYVSSLYADTSTNLLYAGGRFQSSGSTQLNYVGYWDGIQWNSLGAGFNNRVCDITMYNGELYATGFFGQSDTSTVNYIAKWNGNSWQQVGGGLNYPAYALYVFNGKLYVGGSFTSAGNVSCKYIACWDGSVWSSLDTNISPVSSQGLILAISEFQNHLVIGGSFIAEGTANNISILNNGQWQSLAGGTNGYVYSAKEINGELVVTGDFSMVDIVSSQSIAKWNGINWMSVIGPMSAVVTCQAEFNNNLVFGGEANSFTNLGWGYSSPSIACFNNNQQTWTGIDSGFYYYVNDLQVMGNTLYVGGAFNFAGNDSALNIAQIDCSALNVSELKNELRINVYPNPATVKVNFQLVGMEGKKILIVYNQIGKEICRKETNENQIEFLTGGFATGLYFYRIENLNGEKIDGKFIIHQ